MSSSFNSSPARRVLSGAGCLAQLSEEAERLRWHRSVLISSRTLAEVSDIPARVEALIGPRLVGSFHEMPQHTPEAAVNRLAAQVVELEADAAVSLGGGSVIDGVKAAIHASGLALTHIALPTTLSGAEFTASAGITDSATGGKRGLFDPDAAPRLVLLDPELTVHTPARLWLSSGVRGLDHAVESLWAPEQSPLADLLGEAAAGKLLQSLPQCREEGGGLQARANAQQGAWWAALAMAGVSMGPSHILSRMLGAKFHIPHGITSCLLLPATIEYQAAQSPALVEPLAAVFGASAPAAVAGACRDFIAGLGLPTRMRDVGLKEADLARYLELVPAEWRSIPQSAW